MWQLGSAEVSADGPVCLDPRYLPNNKSPQSDSDSIRSKRWRVLGGLFLQLSDLLAADIQSYTDRTFCITK